MGLLLSKLATIENGHLVLMEDGKLLAAFEVVDFGKILRHSFYQIIHYGREDLSVMVGLIRSLRIIQESVSSDNQIAFKTFTEYFLQKVEPELKVDYEREWMRHELTKLNH